MKLNIPTAVVAVVMIGALLALAILGAPGTAVASAGVLTTLAGAALPRLLGNSEADE